MSSSSEWAAGHRTARKRRVFAQVRKDDDNAHAYGALPIREGVVTPDVRAYHAPGDSETRGQIREKGGAKASKHVMACSQCKARNYDESYASY
jgi:imidazolonepropionase-like amidohydrolase